MRLPTSILLASALAMPLDGATAQTTALIGRWEACFQYDSVTSQTIQPMCGTVQFTSDTLCGSKLLIYSGPLPYLRNEERVGVDTIGYYRIADTVAFGGHRITRSTPNCYVTGHPAISWLSGSGTIAADRLSGRWGMGGNRFGSFTFQKRQR